MTVSSRSRGVEISGTGTYLPREVLHNADLERMMDTTDEWIVQRTGVRTRHRADPEAGEETSDMAHAAAKAALADAGIGADEVDLCIVASISQEMNCPSVSCRVMGKLADEAGGQLTAGAFDVLAACSGFVYGLNIAAGLMATGEYRRVLLVGVERLTRFVAFETHHRDHAVIFGDGASAAVLTAVDDPSKGPIAQAMRSDGRKWTDLYIPTQRAHFPEGGYNESRMGLLCMNGRAVFKFAVSTFSDIIGETLERSGLGVEDVDHFICHQSNVRILESARERFGIPQEKLYVNIQDVGNTSAASVPLCLHELRAKGRIKPGQRAMFVAFGGGLTWTTSLWQL